MRLFQNSNELDPCHVGHHQISDEQIKLGGRIDMPQGFLAISGFHNRVSGVLQQDDQEACQGFIVVRDQDSISHSKQVELF
jgi:hypothetical protein